MTKHEMKEDEWYIQLVPDGATEVGFEEFSEVGVFDWAMLPESVRLIDDYAFELCRNLKELRMHEGVEYIGQSAFYRCAQLERIRLPKSLRVIGDSAFMGCFRLTEMEIPEGVLALGELTFDECGALKTITIPGSVRHIHEGALGYSEKEIEVLYTGTKKQWDELDWPEKDEWLSKVKFVGGQEDTHLNSEEQSELPYVQDGILTIPEGTVSIPRGAFMDNRQIRKVVLPESVKHIGDQAFAYCSNLCEITIPLSVEKIDYQAFKGCHQLREIIYAGNEEQLGAVDWLEKRKYRYEEPDEDFKEFSYWIKFIG